MVEIKRVDKSFEEIGQSIDYSTISVAPISIDDAFVVQGATTLKAITDEVIYIKIPYPLSSKFSFVTSEAVSDTSADVVVEVLDSGGNSVDTIDETGYGYDYESGEYSEWEAATIYADEDIYIKISREGSEPYSIALEPDLRGRFIGEHKGQRVGVRLFVGMGFDRGLQNTLDDSVVGLFFDMDGEELILFGREFLVRLGAQELREAFEEMRASVDEAFEGIDTLWDEVGFLQERLDSFSELFALKSELNNFVTKEEKAQMVEAFDRWSAKANQSLQNCIDTLTQTIEQNADRIVEEKLATAIAKLNAKIDAIDGFVEQKLQAIATQLALSVVFRAPDGSEIYRPQISQDGATFSFEVPQGLSQSSYEATIAIECGGENGDD